MMYNQAFLDRLLQTVRAALPRWSLPGATEVSLLNISENATYLAEEPASGRRIVIRIHRPGYHTAEEITSELAWIEDLRATGTIETPRPIPAQDGSLLCEVEDGGTPRFAVAFEYMTGQEPAQSDDLPGWFRQLGSINARLHQHSRTWARPAGFRRKVWDYDAMLGGKPLWGDWRQGLGLDQMGAEAMALLDRTAACLKDRVDRYGKGPERFGLVHADLRLANLLVDGSRLGVIDFDDCGFSWFVYDFAAAISFMEHEPFIPALMEAWLDGYREVAPLSEEDAAEIPIFIMLRRMLLTAWIASHAETPTAQELGTTYTEGTIALADQFLTRFG